VKPLSVCLLLTVTALMACCASANKPTASTPKPAVRAQISLAGTEWVLTNLSGTPALAGGKATLAFPEAGRVAGNGSCNRFTGAVTITGDALKIGALASTRMACVDESVSKQEDVYLKALGAATRYSYQDSNLLIYCDGFDKPLRFIRAAPGSH
jgi:heat shock protein HslJ